MAALDVTAAGEKYWITPKRYAAQPTDKAVGRGTVFHERRIGKSAAVFVDDGYLALRVSCRAAAGELVEAVPFGLAVSFEVGVEANIDVYEQVRARLPIRADVTAGA
jgi:hypothetical protein